jgi:hypothetical protein
MPIRKPTQNSGACEERKQIIDRINVVLRIIRKVGSPVAEGALMDLRGWIRSRTERTRARKGGL